MKKAVLIILVAIVVIAVGGLVFYNTDMYTEFEKSRIEKQLSKRYGVDFEVKVIDERSVFPEFGSRQGFSVCSKEGIYALGECDWKGTVVTDSYCHYHFAPVMNQELQNIIYDCFSDFCIVRDCCAFGGNRAVVNLVSLDDTSDADAYLVHVNREETFFRVYLKENATREQLQKALDHLDHKNYKGNVYFLSVTDELYVQLSNSFMRCYFPKSSVEDALARYVTCLDSKGLDRLIYNPDDYIKAQYLPRWSKSEISDP